MSNPESDESPATRVIEQGALRAELEPGPVEGELVVRLAGELDMEAAPMLEEQLIALSSGAHRSVLVDLEQLRFVDSTGLQCLLRAAGHARDTGDRLRFRRGGAQLEDLIRLTQVGEILTFVD